MLLLINYFSEGYDMFKEIILEVIPSFMYIIVTLLLSIFTYYIKKYLCEKHSLIEYEKQQLIQKIGFENYSNDINIAKNIINAVEQIGKEYNWEGAIKHAKATELISKKTNLTKDDIFNVIKATVAMFSN